MKKLTLADETVKVAVMGQGKTPKSIAFDHHYCQYIRQALLNCKRFSLDFEAAKYVSEASHDDRVLKALPLAVAPYQSFWVEIDIRGLTGIEDADQPGKAGFLITPVKDYQHYVSQVAVKDQVYPINEDAWFVSIVYPVIVEGKTVDIEHSFVGGIFDSEMKSPVQENLNTFVDIQTVGVWQKAADRWPTGINTEATDADAKVKRLYNRISPYLGMTILPTSLASYAIYSKLDKPNRENLIREFNSRLTLSINETMGSMRQILTLVLLINGFGEDTLIGETHTKRGRTIFKGSSRPLLSFSEIRVPMKRKRLLAPKKAVRAVYAGKRQHTCRGHWRRIGGNVECDHDYHTVDSRRKRCSKCGQLLTLVRAHVRGDPSLGQVESSYKVIT